MATKRVVLHRLSGHRFLGINEQGDKVMVDGDQPATGMRPMELLLTALAGCTAYDVVDIMEKKRQPLARYRVEVVGQRAEEHPRRYTHIVVTHYASGPNVTREALERAVELSHTKYCSVSASLNAQIETRVVLEPWQEEREPQR
ncbi:MAG: OsmC family protein [Meiothermus sp.]|uniref:OsmC family protein n=1 Tax=Meiothermus sp. TaxID=1955249 RepID=UPI0025D45F4B|nr:OsmC family protein [Meiothermus sp.]MCS7057631.1 OsmC family protein [Meiothermus sp.]MCS7193983.1 OsmC family protein [Meiothermus sp.]MCX7741022.1 OsmC family protein [Meiothermus sp.]MDW8090731.1 OsmC family protein [Meiothermus sp.]MDW8480843.1 OsmC family protein [Meiothermus sp.]